MMDETKTNSKLDWRWFEADPQTVYFFDGSDDINRKGNWNHISLEGPHAVERARLIAAAPDLLKWLEWYTSGGGGHPDALLAIAKARGE